MIRIDVDNYQQKVASALQGSVYTALEVSGVREDSISYYVRSTTDTYLSEVRSNFINALRPAAKTFLEFYNKYSEEKWKLLPTGLPEVKQLRRKKAGIRRVWAMRPKW